MAASLKMVGTSGDMIDKLAQNDRQKALDAALAQIDRAFANVELNLRDAGGKGWEQVFRVNSYHVPLNNEAMEAMVRNFRKYMPGHEPLWTCVGVSRLGEDDMRVEIEVVAHDPK